MTMTAAAEDNTPAAGVVEPDVIDDELIARLAGQARAQGVSLVGEGGLLQQLIKRALKSALEGEMDSHLAFE